MVANRRIASTPLDGLRPLGTAGQRSYELIARAVDEAFGEEHKRVFAEPVPSPAGDMIDWYSEASEPPVPLDRLEDVDRSRALERLGEIVGDILGHADRLETSDDPEKKRLGAALRNATEIPGEGYIYAAGDQPVVICWSYHLSTSTAQRGVLSAHVPARPDRGAAAGAGQIMASGVSPGAYGAATGPMATAAVMDGPTGLEWLWWLLWLLIGLVTAIIVYLLITACGIATTGVLNFCPAGASERVLGERERAESLEEELARLHRELGQADLQCRTSRPLPERRAEAPPPPEPPADDFTERVERESDRTEGQLMVTLIWDSRSDLDLSVHCPGGERIDFQNRTACGGALDVDANASDNRMMQDPVENVIFDGEVPRGRFSIVVNLFNLRNSGSRENFRVKVHKASGDLFFEGSLRSRGDDQRFTFNYP